MAVQERFQVSITNDKQNPHEGVIAQIKWGNYKVEGEQTNYQETRKYPSLQTLVSQVSREKILSKLEYAGAWVFAIAGDYSAIEAVFFGNFGEYDTAVKISSVVVGVGSNVVGALLLLDGINKSSKASAILRQVQRTVNYSIASTPPQP